LKGFYELARQAKIYVGGDTGPTHLAIAGRRADCRYFRSDRMVAQRQPERGRRFRRTLDIGCRPIVIEETARIGFVLDIPVETVFRAVRERIALNETEK
jgi:predicted DNA-binding transcriptional regulator YafY